MIKGDIIDTVQRIRCDSVSEISFGGRARSLTINPSDMKRRTHAHSYKIFEKEWFAAIDTGGMVFAYDNEPTYNDESGEWFAEGNTIYLGNIKDQRENLFHPTIIKVLINS